MSYFNQVLKTDPYNELALTRKADSLLINSNIQEAINLYESILKLNKNNEDALFGLGFCNQNLNNIDKALDYYNKILNINEENPNALYNKAIILLNKGYKMAANELFIKVKNINDFPHILFLLGLNKLKDKKFDSANKNFDSCIEKNLKTPEVYLSKGQALYGNGDYVQALQYIDAVINSKSNYYNAWNSKANILDKIGKKKEALQWYKAAAESKPENALFLINYCISLLENGYKEQCKQILIYTESIYKSQKDLFNEQEFDLIEKNIKILHDKFNNANKID